MLHPRSLVFFAFLCTQAVPTPAAAVGGQLVAPSPLGGNGHNVSFDGRIYIVRQHVGWMLSVFRPQNVRYNANGPVLTSGAFSTPALVQNPTSQENALAICEASAGSTPYRCNDAGTRTSSGAYECYDFVIIDSDAVSGPKDLRRRTLKVWIASPGTATARLHRHQWTSSISHMGRAAGGRLRGIEPTVTRDGRLMVYQGHPNNNGEIDVLMYATNDNACALGGWHGPYPISHMHADPRVRGRYRMGERQLRAADGTPYADGALFRGAYPWLFPDGDALTFTAAGMPCRAPEDPVGCGPRRNALSVIGYPTNWGLGHIDGDVNPSTADNVRLFFSSPGPIFDELPLTGGIDVWPFFGTNTSDYTELVFDDALDGRYGGVWHMNESINVQGNLDLSRSPDTSGYFNTAVVHGAVFPQANNGLFGKALIFDGDGDYIEVANHASLNPVNGLSVEMWIRPTQAVDCDGNNNYRLILGKGQIHDGTYTIGLEEGEHFQARVNVGGVQRAIRSAASVPLHQWSHVGFTYDAASGTMRFFINGRQTAVERYAPGTITGTSHPLRIGGPGGARARCPNNDGSFHGAIDEVRVSRVARDLTLVSRPGNASRLVGVEVTRNVTAGQAFSARVTYRNVGSTVWSPAMRHRLGAQNPRDNTRWGAARFALPRVVQPGEEVTIVAALRAPAAAGTYPLQFGMLHEGVAWFGPLTTSVNIRVTAPPAPDAGPRDSGPAPRPDAGPMPRPDSGPMPRPDSGPMPRPDGGPMPRPDSGPMLDGGPTPDAGGHAREDAGPLFDAGWPDGGQVFDAGNGIDAGNTPDASRAPDGDIDAGSEPPPAGGCSASPTPPASSPLLLLLFAAMMYRRRK